MLIAPSFASLVQDANGIRDYQQVIKIILYNDVLVKNDSFK